MKLFLKPLLCLLLLFASCQEKKDHKITPVIHQNKIIPNTFKSHFFVTGPGIDEKGNLELGCDCCSSEFYFCDASNFIQVSYCLGGNDVLTGKYKPVENGIEFQYNRKRLFIEIPEWDSEVDSLADKVIYSEVDNRIPKEKIYWKKKDSRFYQTSDFDIAEKQDSSIVNHVKWLKEDTKVYDYLKKNIKPLNF